jgi:DNA polymerase-3 subunit gamma/tau
MLAASPAPAPAALAQPRSFREVVALASGRAPMVHAHLLHSTHLVAFAPGRIEMRQTPAAPRDLAAQLSALLLEQTGSRWTISLSNAEGEPTIAQQRNHVASERLEIARAHPMVQAILLAFPGALVETLRDDSLDAYGLPPAPEASDTPDAPDDGPDFAPPDAEFAGLGDLDP